MQSMEGHEEDKFALDIRTALRGHLQANIPYSACQSHHSVCVTIHIRVS